MKGLEAIEQAISALLCEEKRQAEAILSKSFARQSLAKTKRQYSTLQSIKTFLRDGFIDRYSGERLLFPGALRILSLELPKVFPYQSHWKTSETHIAYWYFHPTVDHVVPVARGGSDSQGNLVTTSQMRNSAKSHWLLEEFGWELNPPGQLDVWDGLLTATQQYVDKNPWLLRDSLLGKWHRAAMKAS